MSLEHHSLVKEFPEHKETIHDLKMNNAHFARLFDEYDELDKAVYRGEDGENPTSDDHLEEMKRRRAALKDDLYNMIKSHKAA